MQTIKDEIGDKRWERLVEESKLHQPGEATRALFYNLRELSLETCVTEAERRHRESSEVMRFPLKDGLVNKIVTEFANQHPYLKPEVQGPLKAVVQYNALGSPLNILETLYMFGDGLSGRNWQQWLEDTTTASR